MDGMFQESKPKSGEMDEIRAQKTRDSGQKKIDFWLLSSSSVDLHQSDDCDGSDEGKKKKKKKLRRVHSEGASESVKMNLRSSSSTSLSSCSSETLKKVDVASGMLVGNRKELERKSRSSSVSSHGSVSLCGRRRAMEDAVTVAPGLNISEKLVASCDFFGVYDGHGGCVVAHVCRDRLHRILANEIETEAEALEAETKGADKIDWEKIMTSCFLKMDDEIRQKGTEMESINSTGSTAVVALVSADKIIVANCGDSRAVLSRGGVAVPLSRDHKPDRPDEMERVEAAGGNVINWNGYRILGVLATSRSIGDQYLKPFVISVPEVTVTERKDEDEFLILASDGLWDVMPNEVACDIIRRFLDIARKKRLLEDEDVDDIIPTETWNTDQAAAMLAGLAMARGSKDNISVVVVELNHCTQRMIP